MKKETNLAGLLTGGEVRILRLMVGGGGGDDGSDSCHVRYKEKEEEMEKGNGERKNLLGHNFNTSIEAVNPTSLARLLLPESG